MFPVRIRLPGGKIKVKTYRYLRSIERDKKVPVIKLGGIYIVWSPNKHRLDRSQSG
jgi:hypothetical protein